MAITLDGTTGITTPGLTNTGTETIVSLTTTGNTTLGDATTDTLTVGVTGIVKDASGYVGIGTTTPIRRLTVSQPSSTEFVLQESAGGTDAKNWRIFNTSNLLYIGTLNDAGNAGVDMAILDTSGNLKLAKSGGKILNTSGNAILQQTGSILQVQSVYLTSTTQLTSGGALHELSTSLRIAFTPVSASSTLYFQAFGSFCSPNSAQLQYAAFYNVTAAAYVNLPPASGSRKQIHWINRTAPVDVNDFNSLIMEITVANTTTTARTYTIYHGSEAALSQFLASTLSTSAGGTYPLFFKITEVAA